MHVCACGDKSMDGLWLNWDSELLFFFHMAAKTNLEMEADRSKYCCTIPAGCLRLCDQFWVASPPPSSTWQIGIFSPLPLKRANLAAGRELMDGRQPGAQVMLPLFFFFFFFSVPAYCRSFSWFLPGDRSAMPSKCFFLSVPVHSYRSNLTQGYLISGFFFFLLPCYSTPSRSTPPAHHSTVKQSAPSALPVGKHPPALHSRPVCWFLPVSPRGSLFLLMSVVSAHGAAPSQLNAAPPSQTSNQSKERSIPCCLMFIKAADICAASTSAAPQRLRHETTGFCNIRRETAGDGAERFFVCC